MFAVRTRIFLIILLTFSSHSLIANITSDEIDLIQNSNQNLQQTLLKLDQNQLKARKVELTKEVQELSLNKSETQNPYTNKKLTTQLKNITEELELIDKILLTLVGLNIIIVDSNNGVGMGAGGSSGGNSGTGTGTGG
ncbi:hypothetical protein OAM91_04460 [Gammaproteobacteria bacterium]|nr:hypothetical protein [Gammaproteobacteria bacterium]